MKRFTEHAVGILQGAELLFTAHEDGGEMWTGTGVREHRQALRFPQPFRDVPVVHIGLSMWDIAHGSNHRVDIRAEEISRDGFTIVFATWEDTRVARVRADWLAIGPVAFEGDFDV